MHLATLKVLALLVGQGPAGVSVEQLGHMDPGAGADDVCIVGRRDDADCLCSPAEQIAHVVDDLLKKISSHGAPTGSKYLVEEDDISCWPGGT